MKIFWKNRRMIHEFFFHSYATHRDLHSFPTRRSSDLSYAEERASRRPLHKVSVTINIYAAETRSEEHTSELQSRYELQLRLMLEKKVPATLLRSTSQNTRPEPA